jgi:hypothetical protein
MLEAGKADTYYCNERSGLVQAIPVELNYRYRQDFQNLTAGISTLVIPPGNGQRCPVIVLEFSAADLATPGASLGKFALPKGWGYQAIKQVSWRIGGASQFFLSGAQLLAKNLRMCRTQSQRQAILDLGGNAVYQAADFAAPQRAYIPLSFWCAPAVDGIALPLPGDLLSQQIVITAELNPTSAYWVTNVNSGIVGGSIPSALSTGYFRTEQYVMNDRSMSLAAKYDMNAQSYSMPVVFDQQEQVITNLSATTDTQSVVLTGFRAGLVREIQVWLEDATPAPTVAPGSNTAVASLSRFIAPEAVQMLYAGTVYADYTNGESKVWNLIDGTAPNSVDCPLLVVPSVAGAISVSSPPLKSEWVSLPFAQRTGDDFEGEVLTAGKSITNGIINLSIKLPDAGALGSVSKYRLHAVYVYGAALNFSRGTCDYFF